MPALRILMITNKIQQVREEAVDKNPTGRAAVSLSAGLADLQGSRRSDSFKEEVQEAQEVLEVR